MSGQTSSRHSNSPVAFDRLLLDAPDRTCSEVNQWMVLLSVLSAAAAGAVPPCLLQLLEALKGSLGDVKSWVDLPKAGLSDQRQTAQP